MATTTSRTRTRRPKQEELPDVPAESAALEVNGEASGEAIQGDEAPTMAQPTDYVGSPSVAVASEPAESTPRAATPRRRRGAAAAVREAAIANEPLDDEPASLPNAQAAKAPAADGPAIKAQAVSASAETFQWLGRDLYLTGLVSSHTGSLSSRSGDSATMTQRMAMLGHLGPDDLLPLPLDEPPGQALPDEAVVHQAVYRATDAQAVIYARPPATMALALVEDRLSPPDGDTNTFGTAPVLIAQRPLASPDLAMLIARILKENRIVALRGVGVFARGADLPDALFVVSLLEEMCRMTCLYRGLSGTSEDGQPRQRGGFDRQPGGPPPYGNRPNGPGGGRPGDRRPPRNQGGQGGGGGWRNEGPPRDRDGGPRRPGGPPQHGGGRRPPR